MVQQRNNKNTLGTDEYRYSSKRLRLMLFSLKGFSDRCHSLFISQTPLVLCFRRLSSRTSIALFFTLLLHRTTFRKTLRNKKLVRIFKRAWSKIIEGRFFFFSSFFLPTSVSFRLFFVMNLWISFYHM